MSRLSLRPTMQTLVAIIFCLSSFSTVFAQVPASNHIVVVVEENHSYSSVIGNSSMPYLNDLANKYGLATNYFANTHPSIGNYFMMTTGQIITNDDGYASVVTADNVVRQVLSAGKTWKSYAESLPSVGYTGGDSGLYLKHHNPFAYFSDVVNSSTEKLNLVPFTQFTTDLANNALPDYSFIVPNACSDAHDCSLTTADTWLQTNIDPLIKSAVFQQDGILVILFDESYSTDTTNGGGHIAAVVISPQAKLGYKSTTFYQHQSLLKMTLSALGITTLPGAAATAPNMSEFFTTSTTTPSFALSATPTSRAITVGMSTTYGITLTPSGGFTGAVAFRVSGLPSGATASFSPASLTTSGSSTLTVATSSSTPTGTYTLNVIGTGGGLTKSVPVTLSIAAAATPDFGLTATPSSTTISRGSSAKYAITLTPSGGFSSTVAFTVGGLPAGATATFTPASLNTSGSTTLSVVTSRAASSVGAFTLNITGSGGGLTRSISVSLGVTKR